jgi:dTDP-4-amino-4,6-dideoxygalactose transaminase
MSDEFLIFGEPDIGPQKIADVVDSIERGLIETGPKAHRFEEMLAEYLGVTPGDQDNVVEALRTHLVTRIGIRA